MAATSSAATAVGPPVDGVGWRADPSTVLPSSTTIASIFVPPKSIPPRSRGEVALSMEGILSGPGLAVVLLLRGRLIDRDPERGELEVRHLLVDRRRHGLNAR